MRNVLLAVSVVAALVLGLAVAVLGNANYALAEEVLRIERENQDLVIAIEELDAEVWARGLALDAAVLEASLAPDEPLGVIQ